ncbi:hypothetical protein PI125_g1977 [Phytophthora idaei]|nr:hypothetical protein PI125_g1977 [Phytophthora idaei]
MLVFRVVLFEIVLECGIVVGSGGEHDRLTHWSWRLDRHGSCGCWTWSLGLEGQKANLEVNSSDPRLGLWGQQQGAW